MGCCFLRMLFFLLTYGLILGSPICQHENEITKEVSEEPVYSDNEVTPDTITPIDQNSVLEGHDNKTENGTAGWTKPCSHHGPNSKHPGQVNSTHIGCVCALFTTQFPIEDDVPIMSKTLHNVSCHAHGSGEDACTKVCISFALSHYKEKDDIICSHIYNATDINIYLQTKVCHVNNKWFFTGLSTSKPICCQEGQVVLCQT